MRRSRSDGYVFSLTQPASPQGRSLAFQILQKQAQLRRLQFQLEFISQELLPPHTPKLAMSEQLEVLEEKITELSNETHSLEHVLERTTASLRVVKDKVTQLADDKQLVEKRLQEVASKVARTEDSAFDMNLRLAFSEQTAIGQNEIRGCQIAQGVSELRKAVDESKSLQQRVQKTDTLTEKQMMKEKVASRDVILRSLRREKEKVRVQLKQVRLNIQKVIRGMGETDLAQCVEKYKNTADSVETLSQQAQILLEKVTEAEKEKAVLEAVLKGTSLPPISATPKPRYEDLSFSCAYEQEEPKWVSYYRSSFKLLLKAVDLVDDCHKLGPDASPSGLSLALLLEKKLLTALCVAQQRAKIRAKVSGSRKLRSITKAAILNKNVRPRQLAPYNPKQVNWEVNVLKEKMYTSHFVRDVCLPGSALSPQVKISSSERLEGLLSGAARLKYEVKSKIAEDAVEQPPLPRSEEPSQDFSETQFVSELQTHQKKRSIALSLFARHRCAIFKNMISLAADRRRKRLRTVSSSSNIRPDLEGIMGVHGIAKQIRMLDAQLGAMTKKGQKDSSPSLKEIYNEMAAARKRAKACATSKPQMRVQSPPSKETESDLPTSKPSQRLLSPVPMSSQSRASDYIGRLNSFASPRSFKS